MKQNDIDCYVAILDNVTFEWEDYLHVGKTICKQECIQYLDTYFPTYLIKSFELKRTNSKSVK